MIKALFDLRKLWSGTCDNLMMIAMLLMIAMVTRLACFFFPPILEEGEDETKKENIKPHHIAQLYGVMMARMLSKDLSIVNIVVPRIVRLIESRTDR